MLIYVNIHIGVVVLMRVSPERNILDMTVLHIGRLRAVLFPSVSLFEVLCPPQLLMIIKPERIKRNAGS